MTAGYGAQRLNSCLLKTVSQPFSGFPKTTEKCRLFQCGRFKGVIDFYLGSPPSPRFCACLLACFPFFYFFDQVFKIPLSEGDGSRERGPPLPVPSRRAGHINDPCTAWGGGAEPLTTLSQVPWVLSEAVGLS